MPNKQQTLLVLGSTLTGHALDQVLQRTEGDVGANILLYAVGMRRPLRKVAALPASQIEYPKACMRCLFSGLGDQLRQGTVDEAYNGSKPRLKVQREIQPPEAIKSCSHGVNA